MTHQDLDWQDIFEETVGLSVVITLGKANPGKLFFSVKADVTQQTHYHEVCFSVDFRNSIWSHVTPLSGLLEVTFGDSRLRIEPRDTELVLSLHSTFSLLCYGDRELVWEREGQPLAALLEHKDGVFVSNLTLSNVTGNHTGEYACTYSPEQAPEPADRRALYIYVPGRGHHVLACGFPCGGVFLEKHKAALVKFPCFSNHYSLSPTDPSLVFLPAVPSDEAFIFITGYTEAVIPCRVTNPQMQVTLYEKKVEIPIPATYDPQQGFKGFFEDKTYFCRTFVDDQEVDSNTFYVYRIQGELALS